MAENIYYDQALNGEFWYADLRTNAHSITIPVLEKMTEHMMPDAPPAIHLPDVILEPEAKFLTMCSNPYLSHPPQNTKTIQAPKALQEDLRFKCFC